MPQNYSGCDIVILGFQVMCIIFLVSVKNILACGFSLEVSHCNIFIEYKLGTSIHGLVTNIQ